MEKVYALLNSVLTIFQFIMMAADSAQGIGDEYDDKYDGNDDEYDYEDDDEDEYSTHSGFSDAFDGLELMEQIDQIEETAEQIGLAFNHNAFYENLATLHTFVDAGGDDEDAINGMIEQEQKKETKMIYGSVKYVICSIIALILDVQHALHSMIWLNKYSMVIL